MTNQNDDSSNDSSSGTLIINNSFAGYILSCKRSRLSGVKAKMLIFLNKNL